MLQSSKECVHGLFVAGQPGVVGLGLGVAGLGLGVKECCGELQSSKECVRGLFVVGQLGNQLSTPVI